ncbi:MarR family transcriptional regulator [Methylobacterium nonmethylotrophicum]|uniref:MarR family transcriptional regulator n=1 Tax=Methylobacterium nonmethylotrophicum TaxID=1141884 RepID=A0A4Z0NHT3_9HYPH|nr:MarR family transcriptional regulator [Methylobacterium nonmethylotrophicum]TGD95888.1 MarR family transcriptional regulator [Methylobacterium nonmethylotrophicum]
MSETPTPQQALILWRLLGRQGTALNSEIAPRKAERDGLCAAGLLTAEKEGRSSRLTVTDKGWNWAGRHLRDPLPPNARVLQDWLTRLHHHLEATGATLAEFVGPAPERAPPEPKVRAPRSRKGDPARKPRSQASVPKAPDPHDEADPDQLRTRIERAYLACTKGRKSTAVRLSALRAALSDLDRATVDAGLAAVLRGDDSIRLTRISDPKALDAAERAAAFSPAGEPFHEIWINA